MEDQRGISFDEFCKKHDVTDEERNKLITFVMAITFEGRMKFLYQEVLKLNDSVQQQKEYIASILQCLR